MPVPRGARATGGTGGTDGTDAGAVRPTGLRRPGLRTLLLGVVLLVGPLAMLGNGRSQQPLGVQLLLVAVVTAGLYLTVGGLFRLRVPDDGWDPLGPDDGPGTDVAELEPGSGGRRCRVLGHRETFVARSPDRPPHWHCSRCGGRSLTHLGRAAGWTCRLPLVDHLYDGVGATERAPQHWRCRRCGHRRFTPPMSVGETLDGTRAATQWIRREE